jgi:hypothetical protein
MILAAHDVRHRHVDVVDYARQQIEPAAVGAADDGIADQRRVEFLRSADEVGPFDRRAMVEPEAPMWGDALGHRRVGGFPLIHGRQPASEQHLAAQVELLGRFVAGINSPRFTKPLELALVEGKAFGLAKDRRGLQPEPRQVIADRLVILGGRALGVGIVDAQQEAAAMAQRE